MAYLLITFDSLNLLYIPPRGPGFCSMSPDSSSRDTMTEAAIDTATSSTHFGRHKPFLKILVLTVLPVLWSIAIYSTI